MGTWGSPALPCPGLALAVTPASPGCHSGENLALSHLHIQENVTPKSLDLPDVLDPACLVWGMDFEEVLGTISQVTECRLGGLAQRADWLVVESMNFGVRQTLTESRFCYFLAV